MKKTSLRSLSLILLLSMIFSSLSLFVYAEDSQALTQEKNIVTEHNSNELLSKNILSFSCLYNPQSKTVNIKGIMNHDAFALYGGSTLLIYSIPAGKTENDVINDPNATPISESSVSITFAFSFKISSIEERHCRYAVFIRTSDGKYILTTEAQYAETDAPFTLPNSKDAFKGLSGDYSSKISSINSQTTIIPIYLDLIYSTTSSGYMYQAEEYQISFNKSYIDELDAQIRSLSYFGTTVYLQFLLRSGGVLPTHMHASAKYALPDTFEKQTIIFLHAVTNFLTERYSNGLNGNINGIILGKAWDNASKYNSFESINFEKYVSMCGNYTAIVSNAARDINPNLNIVLSFDGNGFFIEQDKNATSNDRFSAKALLSSLMAYFDASSYSGLKCLILIEAYETPLDISENDIENGIDINKKLNDDKFYIGNHESVSSFLEDLSNKYKSATKYYHILWIPKSDLAGNALCASYSYAFYKLLTDGNVLSFTVEFSSKAENEVNFSDLFFVIKNIDSESSFDTTKSLLDFFGKNNWFEVIKKNDIPTFSQKKHYTAETLSQLPKNIKGKFSYFDFSQTFLTDGWLNGAGSGNLKIDYLPTGEKALTSDFSVSNNDFCDLIYLYEYSENISYTPYISFNIEIISEQLSPLYEIKFLFDSENATFESNTVIKGNQLTEIVLNMSKAKDFSLLNGVKISVRTLDDTVDSCTLSIGNIIGYSKKYNSKELTSLIEKERDKQKNNNLSDDYNLWFKIASVTIIILISAILGFVLILILQKNSRSRRKD